MAQRTRIVLLSGRVALPAASLPRTSARRRVPRRTALAGSVSVSLFVPRAARSVFARRRLACRAPGLRPHSCTERRGGAPGGRGGGRPAALGGPPGGGARPGGQGR